MFERHARRRWRLIVSSVLLLLGLSFLFWLVLQNRTALLSWVPPDYQNFQEFAADFYHGQYNTFYPLPTLIWVFLPLYLLPAWFAFIWIGVPFIFCLYLFGKKGVVLWLFFPLLIHAYQGQFDGWFLLPLAWLLYDHSRLAGPSAAVLTLKPQLAVFVVPFMLYRWTFRTKNWRSLFGFVIVLFLLLLPAFWLEPQWPLLMLEQVGTRASQPLLLTRGASLWGWWWRGGWSRWLLPVAAGLILYLAWRAWRLEKTRARVAFLLSLLFTPVFFALSFTTVLAVLPNRREALLGLLVLSWIAVLIDQALGGWGGVYALLPMAALWFLVDEVDTGATLPGAPDPV